MLIDTDSLKRVALDVAVLSHGREGVDTFSVGRDSIRRQMVDSGSAQDVTGGYLSCMADSAKNPGWGLLFETASAQEGYFITGQAADAGYSTQLLFKHIRAGGLGR